MAKAKYFMGILVLVFAIYYKYYSHESDGPIVNTNYGQLRGIVSQSRQGKPIVEFLGIPYATPPIKDLRFEAPKLPVKWEGVRDATKYGSICMQIELLFGVLAGSEDCLFLNVFTPKIPSIKNASGISSHDEDKLLPVMLYIHGGLFQNGDSNLWRPAYILDENVVMISINYRLSALGFLSTGDGLIRGNMGLKDISMAVRWVHENINNFGGDPDRITLFGESCGGMGAHYQMLSPMSKGYFSGIISQTGAAFNFWTLKHEPRKQALRLGKNLGCPTDDLAAIVQCLKNVDASAIVYIQKEVLDPLRSHLGFYKPVVEAVDDEHTFVSKSPYEIVASGNYTKVPWMVGVNSNEGLFQAASIVSNKTLTNYEQQDWSEFIRNLLMFERNDNVSQQLKDFYFDNISDVTTFYNLHRYAQMFSDRVFFNDIHHGAKLQAKSSPVYLYYYTYRGEWSTANLFMEMKGKYPRLIEATFAVIFSGTSWLDRWINTLIGRTLPNYGASHSDELALLFQMPWVADVLEGSPDYSMSIDLVKLWVSFAKQLDRKDLKFRNVSWDPVNSSDTTLRYLNLDVTPKMINEPFTKRVEFWDSLKFDNIAVTSSPHYHYIICFLVHFHNGS